MKKVISYPYRYVRAIGIAIRAAVVLEYYTEETIMFQLVKMKFEQEIKEKTGINWIFT